MQEVRHGELIMKRRNVRWFRTKLLEMELSFAFYGANLGEFVASDPEDVIGPTRCNYLRLTSSICHTTFRVSPHNMGSFDCLGLSLAYVAFCGQ